MHRSRVVPCAASSPHLPNVNARAGHHGVFDLRGHCQQPLAIVDGLPLVDEAQVCKVVNQNAVVQGHGDAVAPQLDSSDLHHYAVLERQVEVSGSRQQQRFQQSLNDWHSYSIIEPMATRRRRAAPSCCFVQQLHSKQLHVGALSDNLSLRQELIPDCGKSAHQCICLDDRPKS